MAEFNLIDEQWIQCIDLKGNQIEYGILDVLLKAHDLREICDDSPLATVAVHRMLLAILYRAFGRILDTSHWKARYQVGKFASEDALGDYLTKWHDRFFLFDAIHPFMQIAELDLNDYKANGEVAKDRTDGLMRLAKEAPDKGGRILFDHRMGTERPEYDCKRIVRMILSAQSFEGTGIASSGKIGDQKIAPTPCLFAPCVDGLCLWLQGANLFETLMLNLVPDKFCAGDLPAWEDDQLLKAATQSWTTPVNFTGTVQRFASISRFIRVLDQKSMFFTNGLKTILDSDDPMKAYTRESSDKPYVAVKLRVHKSPWRDAHALFAVGASNRKPPESLNFAARLACAGVISVITPYRANVVGLATNKGKGLLWRQECMPVSGQLLTNVSLVERLGNLISEAEIVGAQLSRGLFWNASMKKTIRSEPVGRVEQIADLMLSPTLQVRGPGIVRKENGQVPDEAHNKASLDLSSNLDPRSTYWARLELHFFSLLENLAHDWDEVNATWKPDDQQEATRTWREQIKREAQTALEASIRSLGTTARAIQAVARVRTDFNDDDLKPPQQKAAKTKGKGKGAKKNK